MQRLRHYSANTSFWDRVKTAILGLLVVGGAVLFPDFRPLAAVSGGAFLLPWLARHWMVDNLEWMMGKLRLAGLGFFVLALVGNLLPYKRLEQDTQMLLAGGLFALLGLYMGVHFWLLSDSRVYVEQSG